MTNEQAGLLKKAADSLSAAKLLADKGLIEIAVSRAYYTMFYAASAMLLTLNLRFKKHSAVHAASGHRIAHAGILPAALHGWLVDSAKARSISDYLAESVVTAGEAATHMDHAERFLADVRRSLTKL